MVITMSVSSARILYVIPLSIYLPVSNLSHLVPFDSLPISLANVRQDRDLNHMKKGPTNVQPLKPVLFGFCNRYNIRQLRINSLLRCIRRFIGVPNPYVKFLQDMVMI